MIPGFDRDEYTRLVDVFPPMKIGDNAQVAATEERIEELLAKPANSAAERAYIDLLADWEDRQAVIADIAGAELVKVLLQERGLRQRDLVGVFPTESIASAVLSGRRELTREHIERLANFFHVSPAAFFPAQKTQPGRASGAEHRHAPGQRVMDTEHVATRR